MGKPFRLEPRKGPNNEKVSEPSSKWGMNPLRTYISKTDPINVFISHVVYLVKILRAFPAPDFQLALSAKYRCLRQKVMSLSPTIFNPSECGNVCTYIST